MNRTLAHYETARRATATPQDNEILIFTNTNAELAKARGADAKTRIAALFLNQRVWSAIVKDLSLETNQLPDDLKRNLTELGFWAMRYSTRAMTEGLSLDPLIEVNRNMIEGLAAQRANAAPPASASLSLSAV
jgi:flagellar protein FlaF